jgi:hypothetical protein
MKKGQGDGMYADEASILEMDLPHSARSMKTSMSHSEHSTE